VTKGRVLHANSGLYVFPLQVVRRHGRYGQHRRHKTERKQGAVKCSEASCGDIASVNKAQGPTTQEKTTGLHRLALPGCKPRPYKTSACVTRLETAR
jgi:hypothetical protein